jgi:hypothetical protein
MSLEYTDIDTVCLYGSQNGEAPMKMLIRDVLFGLVLRLVRTIAFLILSFALLRRVMPDGMPPPSPVATQPLHRLTPSEAVKTQRPAADVDQAVLVKNGGPVR